MSICPLHKGGSRALPKNYHPVANTSHIIKLFERVIRRVLVEHLEENGFMAPGQHGFRALRSTLTQLLAHWDSILDGLLSGVHGVDSVYLDFAKAFDKVDHGVLLHKLRTFGICGKVGTWLAEFLRNRFQIVTMDGIKSKKEAVIFRVAQGMLLGTGPFLCLISSISHGTDCNTIFIRTITEWRRGL